MDDRLQINQPINPASRTSTEKRRETTPAKEADGTSFEELLKQNLKSQKEVKFSKHARNRLVNRGIEVTKEDMNKLQNAVKKAENKGSQDSLIMVNQTAYVVSVENKTVITAIDDQNIRENVFTNIDSAVFM